MCNQSAVAGVLLEALRSGGDFAEFFYEDKTELNIKMTQQLVSGISTVRIRGAGIRVLSGTKSVYVYTNDLSHSSLITTAQWAAGLLASARKDEQGRIDFRPKSSKNPNQALIQPSSVPHGDKIRVMKEIDRIARSASTKIRHLGLDFFDNDQRILVANSDGLWTEDRRVTSRVRLTITVCQESDSYSHWYDYCHPAGFEAFANSEQMEGFTRDVIQRTEKALNAVDAPSAFVPVVIEAGAGGTFFHESCGHSLESTVVANGSSSFAGKLGERVASDKVTLIDDGTLPGLYGSAGIDDEGTPTRKNVLIENGILKGYLIDRVGGRMMKMQPTGSGRRQNYTFAPAARMSNTYLAAGTDDDDEMIRSMEEGLYAIGFGGGSTNPVTGEFSLAVTEGYWVKKGEIVKPVKGMTLNGKGIEAMKRVDRVGRNLRAEYGGFCGAGSGLVCTTAFQPRVRISGMLVGGKGGSDR